MRLEFDGAAYDLPDPPVRTGEVRIRVDGVVILPLGGTGSEHRFAYKNRFAKLLFFALREGPALTFAKVRAARLQKKLAEARQLVFAYGRDLEEDRPCLALGAQDSIQAEILCFPECLSARYDEEAELWSRYQAARRYLEEDAETARRIFYYSAQSGQPLGLTLDEIAPRDLDKPAAKPTVASLNWARHATECQAAERSGQAASPTSRDLFLAGAGAYAWAYVLPSLPGLSRHSVVDLNATLAALTRQQFGFRFADTDCHRALARLEDSQAPAVVVATYHSTHFDVTAEALARNPDCRVLIEKPPVTDRAQLTKLLDLRAQGAWIEIGYNRRHAPITQRAAQVLSEASGPLDVTCVVKELGIPLSHWYYWPNQGTRIIGNLAHWIDLGCYFIKARPRSLHIVPTGLGPIGDEVTMVVIFDDGSRLTLVSSCKGNALRGVQETIEIRRDEITVTIHDFLRLTVDRGRFSSSRPYLLRDKGHKAMYRRYLSNLTADRPPDYPNDDLERSSRIYLEAVDALRAGRREVDLDGDPL